ncbi:hypothetical protein [Solidesulfovibrio sp.]
MLVDYPDTLSRLETALGRHFADSPTILNVPGVSVALKVDPFYYLALRPAFFELLGKWAAVPPARVEETLSRTGNLVLGPGRVRYDKPLAVFEEGSAAVLKIPADFVPAEWIDRAVVMYGNEPAPLPVSGLRLVDDSQRQALAGHFAGMTQLAALAFGTPAKR